MHSMKSAISLWLKNNCHCQPRLARNQFRSDCRSDPCISSVTTAIMITTSNSSLSKEEQDAQSITRCSNEHHRLFRAVLRTNRTSSIARSPIPCATSSTGERPAYEPWQLWRSFVLAALPGGDTCCAILADCAL